MGYRRLSKGGSFGDNFNAALLGEAGNVAMATGFNWVGDTIKFPDGSVQKIVAHALMGGLLAEATGSDFKTGAAAAGLNEALINQLAWAAQGNDDVMLMLSQLTGLVAAAAVDGDLEKGAQVAQKATTYNWLLHSEIDEADKKRAGCKSLGAGAGACEKKIIKEMDDLDKSRNLEMFEYDRSLQMAAYREGMTQDEYRAALLGHFNGLDPRDLVFTGYAPANELGYRAEAFGSSVVDYASSFPERFTAGLGGLIHNYDKIPAGIAQSARDGVDWFTGPIPAQAVARAEDKLVFSTPEQLGEMAFDTTLGAVTGAVGGAVSGKAIEWFAGRWIPQVGAQASNLKGTGAFLDGVEGGAGFGKLTDRQVKVSGKGLEIVETHLQQFGDVPENDLMITRLRSALAEGKPISGADASFYIHEVSESTMMKTGLDYSAAHQGALSKYQVSPFSVYHPDVIRAVNSTEPGSFNASWLKFWSQQK
ncbi:DUF637 domain-containing protein [Pseudomonas poae]|uniref:DUF637 domain-containing protein n=1 Tax=Pseudomonas poae TaxID=200451 RepID=UPI0034D7ACE9